MRGKAGLGRPASELQRITPAYAGKRGCLHCAGQRTQDHPRVCGEKSMLCRSANSATGSPPRMRGKGQSAAGYSSRPGITPAYAGKRGRGCRGRGGNWDHPRVCGEKAARRAAVLKGLGSPPRMRGKGKKVVATNDYLRITPAYAGKRSSRYGKGVRRGDHPRVCGEKADCAPFAEFEMGSPPRMRGKVGQSGAAKRRGGITPAYAGKREPLLSDLMTGWDHPRVCGEKSRSMFASRKASGSPPRMRGKELYAAEST